MRILLVDDDPLLGEVLAVGLAEGNHSVVLRADAAAAQAVLDDRDGELIELLVSDVDLGPGDSGLDLAAYCAVEHPNLRVFLVSGHPRITFETKLAELARVHFMQKPVDLAALLAVVSAECTAADGRF